MKSSKSIILSLLFVIVTMSSAQEIVGTWNGVLNVQGNELPIVFHIKYVDGSYISTMDSPAQGASGIAIDKTIFEGNKFSIDAKKMGLSYSGTFSDNTIKGTFNQGTAKLPLILIKEFPDQPKNNETKVVSESVGIIGTWSGTLIVPNQELPIVFHISKEDGKLITKMDSPAQGATGLPTDNSYFNKNEYVVEIKKMGIRFIGTLKKGKIEGVFNQGTAKLPLTLIKKAFKRVSKIQEPKKPYPYKSEEVKFINKEASSIIFSGTLTLPENITNPAVAILITGSGPQNRDEEILGHKPFLVLSDYLTRNGIAVLRYDDRGVAESEGSFKDATSADFASDVEAAVSYLETRNDVVDINKIGLIGHSEGGLIAPMVASKNKDISFCVLLASPGILGKDVILTQGKRASEIAGVSQLLIDYNQKYSKKLFNLLNTFNGITLTKKIDETIIEMKKNAPKKMREEFTDEKIAKEIAQITSPWFLHFIRSNPDDFLKNVSCPVLALNGEKDFQVLPKLNLNGIEKSLIKAKNNDYKIKELKGLNHLFQMSETGAMEEYGKIEETFSPIALKEISTWINKRF